MLQAASTVWFKRALLFNLLVTAVSALASQKIGISLPQVIEAATLVALFLMLPTILSTEKKKIRLLLLVASIFSLGYALILSVHLMTQFISLPEWLQGLYYHGLGRHHRLNLLDGYTGTAVNINILAYALLGILLFYRSENNVSSLKFKSFAFLLLALHWLALYFTYSRAALASAFVVLFFYILATVKGRYRPLILLGFASSIVILGTQDSYFQLRLQRTIHLTQDFSFLDRLSIWQRALDFFGHMGLKEWLLGIGPKQMRYFIGMKQPENQYLLELIERGALGLLAHLFLIGAYFYYGVRTFLYGQGLSKGLGWAMACSISALSLHNVIASRFRGLAPYLLILLASMALHQFRRDSSAFSSHVVLSSQVVLRPQDDISSEGAHT